MSASNVRFNFEVARLVTQLVAPNISKLIVNLENRKKNRNSTILYRLIFRVTKYLVLTLIIVMATTFGAIFGFTMYRRYLRQKRLRDELEPLVQLPPNLHKKCSKISFELKLNSHAGGWSLWKPLTSNLPYFDLFSEVFMDAHLKITKLLELWVISSN